MLEKYLWTERYRPKTVDEYVFKDDQLQDVVSKWIREQEIPHIFLYGPAGTGKSSLINLLMNELNIDDKLEIDCSSDNSVDHIRDKVQNYANNMTFSKFKVIILEEFDRVSIAGQKALKRTIEQCSDKTRFILTTNHDNLVEAPIKSRCYQLHIDKPNMEQYMTKVAEILINESVEVSADVLERYVSICYPDMRVLLNKVQQNVKDGVLIMPSGGDASTADLFSTVIDMFKNRNVFGARQFVCKNLNYNDYVPFYQFMYRNLDMFGADEDSQTNALLVVADGLKNHTNVADPEINLAATIIKLFQKGV